MSVAVSYLFVPATRPDRVEKARRSAADEIIVDLEDAVAPEDKDGARQALSQVGDGRPVLVRVNARGSSQHDDDLAAVANMTSAWGVVLPEAESAEDVAAVLGALPYRTAVLALIESAQGVVAADDIARSGAARIMFGSADFLADIGAASSAEVLAYPRSRLVVASRAAGLPGPVDTPTLVLDDEARVRADAEVAKAMGMGGKLCIHPAQVAVVNQVFRSSEEEHRWARAVLEAAEAGGGGAFSFEGAMVDGPVLARARQLLGPD